jgi:hypothetical protein
MMKASRILLLCSAVALPQLALANSQVDAQWLGTVEGILDFCVKVDPKDAASFQALRKSADGGTSEHDLTGLRGTPEYKNGLDTINNALAQVSPQSGAQICAAGVAPKRRVLRSPKQRRPDDSGPGSKPASPSSGRTGRSGDPAHPTTKTAVTDHRPGGTTDRRTGAVLAR